MPLYEYRCENCHSVLEVLQKLNDEPLKICPKCGGKLTKLISQSAIQFKGTGWYITDYARRQPSNGQQAQGNGQEKKETSKTKEASSSDHFSSQTDFNK